MSSWLVASIVLSVVLTVALNVMLWLFPGAGQRLGETLRRAIERMEPEPPRGAPSSEHGRSQVRVVFPWKLMLVASVAVTLAINVLIRLLR